jgi:hypothetical protein
VDAKGREGEEVVPWRTAEIQTIAHVLLASCQTYTTDIGATGLKTKG